MGDHMKELLWDLFKSTGKIEYYMQYKQLVNQNNNDRNSRRNDR